MSCAEVMYHPQPYGAPQYLPNPVAAATCPTACYHPAPQPGQQVSHRPGSLPGAGTRGTRYRCGAPALSRRDPRHGGCSGTCGEPQKEKDSRAELRVAGPGCLERHYLAGGFFELCHLDSEAVAPSCAGP